LNIVPAQKELSKEKHNHILKQLNVEGVRSRNIFITTSRGLLLRKGELGGLWMVMTVCHHKETQQDK
jgi:hypothetical protein